MSSNYIVSLTTYYPRFQYAHTAIESVLSQECPYQYEVHLYIARADIKKNGGIVPPQIEALTEKGLKIFITEEDLLAYDKYVHTLRKNPDKTIITVDDDVIYPDCFLSKLIQKSQEFPGCITCFRGHFLSFTAKGDLLPYGFMMGRKSYNVKSVVPSFCLMPTGVCGVLYPPDSLDEIAVDRELFMNLSPSNDDIWLKMASLKKGTLCVRVEKKGISFPTISGSQAVSLFSINTAKNDSQLQACFSKFPELLEKVKEDYVRLNSIYKTSGAAKDKDLVSGARLCVIKHYVYALLSIICPITFFKNKVLKYKYRSKIAWTLVRGFRDK